MAEITLTWKASNSEDIKGYRIYNGLDLPTSTSNITTYRLTTLQYDVQYHFTVVAVNAEGIESKESNEVVATIRKNFPSAPTNLKIIMLDKSCIEEALSDDEKKYASVASTKIKS